MEIDDKIAEFTVINSLKADDMSVKYLNNG